MISGHANCRGRELRRDATPQRSIVARYDAGATGSCVDLSTGAEFSFLLREAQGRETAGFG